MPKALATPQAGASIPLIDLRVIASIRALDDGADEFLSEQIESLARVGGHPGGDTLQRLDREHAATTAALAGLRGNDGR